jgi:hypothetical protein
LQALAAVDAVFPTYEEYTMHHYNRLKEEKEKMEQELQQKRERQNNLKIKLKSE